MLIGMNPILGPIPSFYGVKIGTGMKEYPLFKEK